MNKRQIANVLRESVFDPKKLGPHSIIVDSSTPTYLVQRSIEYLRSWLSDPRNDTQLTMAVSLLAVAKIKDKENRDAPKERKKQKSNQPKYKRDDSHLQTDRQDREADQGRCA